MSRHRPPVGPGDAIELLCIPHGTFTVADRGADGVPVVFEECWDADSYVIPGDPRPIWDAHVDDPVGVLDEWEATADGLVGRGRLVGGEAQVERIKSLVAEGLRAEASVSFRGSEADEWSRPHPDGLARVVRRGVDPVEVSLVSRGALDGARVLSVGTPPSAPASTPEPSAASPTSTSTPEPVHAGGGAADALAQALADVEGGFGARYRQGKQDALVSARAAVEAGARWRHPAQAPTPPPRPMEALPDAVLARRIADAMGTPLDRMDPQDRAEVSALLNERSARRNG